MMQENESRERFIEGLKLAASKARELAALTHNHEWSNVAAGIDQLRSNGEKCIFQNALTRAEVLAQLDARKEREIAKNG